MPGVGRRTFVAGAVGCGVGFSLTAGRTRANTQSSPVVWTAESGGFVRDYILKNEDVYVGTDQNRLRRLRRRTGEERGRVELSAGVYPDGITATPEYIVVATDNDQMSVYERSALTGSDAAPVWEPPLSGQPMGMDAHDGQVCVATRDGLVALDPSSQEFHWQRYTDNLNFRNFAPPVVWNDSGIVVTGDTSVRFVSPENGEVDLTVSFESPSHINVLKKPPVAITTAGPYVGYSGADAHGCCPSWATLVIDTEQRDIEYRSFSRTDGRWSIGLTETLVARRTNEQQIQSEEFESESQLRASYSPRFDGIVSTPSRTFIADKSAEDSTTALVAIENEGLGGVWSHPFEEPIAHLETAGELLFGVNQDEGRLFALSQTGDRTDIVEASTPIGNGGNTSTGGETPTDGKTAASDGSTKDAPPPRGFFANGENKVIDNFGLTGASTAITVVGIVVTMADMLQRDGD